jgi:Fuc2NAc and GlcNAc transferase
VIAFVFASFAITVVLTGLVRRYVLRRGVLDVPNERSSHTVATPRGGGIAILAAVLGCFAVAGWVGSASLRDAVTLGAGALTLGAVGWVDDHGGVSPRIRLATHFAVALGTLMSFRGLPELRVGTSVLSLGVVGWGLGVIGIVWSINLFNFMDGIDGLAASQTMLILGVAAALLVWSGEMSLGILTLIVAGSCAGFLVWNWPPAKIFLGDVGSGALGYLVSAAAVASENRGAVPLLVYSILGALFLGDATVTLLRRVVRGHRPADAHRDHVYQRMSRHWNSHRTVTLAAGGLTTLFAVLATIASRVPGLVVGCVILVYLVVGCAIIGSERLAPMKARI